jgi:hypothetical protein
MGAGNIVNPLMADTLSVIGTTIFPPLSIGGVQKELETIKTSVPNPSAGEEGQPDTLQVKIAIMDVEESAGTHPDVPGSNPVPPFIPTPPSIQRPTITPVQNTRVFFEGNLVTVVGDGMSTAPTTVPPIRPITDLTAPSEYPKIIIGTNPV